MPDPASHSFFSQRLRLHYVDWGNGNAPAMLLVHGVQDHCRTWDAVARHFCERYHVVAIDLRGHGDSQWAMGGSYAHVDYVYDIAQLVRSARLKPVTIVAHSLGGTVAALFAGIYPEAVERLVVIEGIGLWPGWADGRDPAARIREWIDGVWQLSRRIPKRYASLEEAYRRMQVANPHLTPELALHLTAHGSNQNEDGSFSWKFDNYTHQWPTYGITREDTITIWENITCPVLLVTATGGFEHRIGQDGTLAHFRHAELVEIDDAGHWTHHDQTDDFLRHVDGFLGRT